MAHSGPDVRPYGGGLGQLSLGGMAWPPLAAHIALEPGLGRECALAAMLERYLECAASGQPVHTWRLPAG
jgi:hypothetical protein